MSVLIVALGDGPRDLAALPWALLVLIAAADLALSRRGGLALTYEMRPEVFVGETATLQLDVSPSPGDLRALIDWPDGLAGARDAVFHPTEDGARARVLARGVRRGVWGIADLWLFWPSRFGLFEVVPRLTFGLEVRVVPNIRLVQSGAITTQVKSALFGVKENRAVGEGSEFHQLRDFVQGMDVKTNRLG